jgi:hypothetical protein
MNRPTQRACPGILALAGVAIALAAAAGPARGAAPADSLAGRSTTRTARAGMSKQAVRTLDAVHIEGEIAVPQVLFITARDFRRFRDGLGSTYQRSIADVAGSVSLPHRLRIVAQELNKEEGK